MRIAYPIYNYTKPGGIERYVRILAEKLSQQHEIHIFTTSPGENKNIIFHKISIPKGPFFYQLHRFSYKVVEEIKKFNFDIVHNQGADCLFQDVITAHSCHRAWVEYAKKFSFFEFLKKNLNPLHRVVLRNEKYNFTKGNYKKIIAISENVKQELVHYYQIPSEDIKVIFPGVDINEFNPQNRILWRKEIRNKYSLSEDEYIILFVANEFRRKGLAVLLKALSKIKNPKVKLMVIGGGNKFFYTVLIKKLNIKNRVMFISQTHFINRYYGCGDILVLPTKYEPTGFVVMEAMASGIPVIVSKVAGTSELLDEPLCRLNNPLDENELAEKLLFFIENKEYGIKLGYKLRKKIEDYTWEKVVTETLKVYQEVYKKINVT